jgi:hypothetical protein
MEVLNQEGIELSHDLIQFLSRYFDTSDLEDLDMRDFSYLQDLRDQLVRQLDDSHFLCFAQSTGLHFWTSFADNAFLPIGFGNALGTVIVLFLGDVLRFSLAAASTECPCPTAFLPPFLCPNCPFCMELPRWSDFIEVFREGRWNVYYDAVQMSESGSGVRISSVKMQKPEYVISILCKIQ